MRRSTNFIESNCMPKMGSQIVRKVSIKAALKINSLSTRLVLHYEYNVKHYACTITCGIKDSPMTLIYIHQHFTRVSRNDLIVSQNLLDELMLDKFVD